MKMQCEFSMEHIQMYLQKSYQSFNYIRTRGQGPWEQETGFALLL